jgi:hypothetical protein
MRDNAHGTINLIMNIENSLLMMEDAVTYCSPWKLSTDIMSWGALYVCE